MPRADGPVQVIANRDDDMARLAIDTQNVHHVSLFDGHWISTPKDTACRFVFAASNGKVSPDKRFMRQLGTRNAKDQATTCE